MTGELSLELQLDHALRSDDPDLSRTTLEGTADAEIDFWLTSALSSHTKISLDSTDNRLSDENLIFGEVGLRVEELYLRFDIESYRIIAGKFAIDFGVAWDDAFGLYGSDLAEEYEFKERVGVHAEVRLKDTGTGTHR
ncbi:MAG: hypothetical protein ACR2PM_08290, partial [Hyphomicrobiales bacterium]